MKETVSITVPGTLQYNHFINDAGELFLRERLFYFEDELLQSFVQDFRIIMYEAFTNAVYHSQCPHITVELSVDSYWYTVIFKTNNVGFCIIPYPSALPHLMSLSKILPPYPEHLIGKELLIYHDGCNQVYCTIAGPWTARLKNIRLPLGNVDLNSIPEHYGINLITKFSHETLYYRDENNIDCFLVRRRIG